MRAIIRDFRKDPKNPVIIAEVTINPEDSVAFIESADERLKRMLMTEGIIGAGAKRYMPEDGQVFIQEMPNYFKSPYLRAEVVLD